MQHNAQIDHGAILNKIKKFSEVHQRKLPPFSGVCNGASLMLLIQFHEALDKYYKQHGQNNPDMKIMDEFMEKSVEAFFNRIAAFTSTPINENTVSREFEEFLDELLLLQNGYLYLNYSDQKNLLPFYAMLKSDDEVPLPIREAQATFNLTPSQFLKNYDNLFPKYKLILFNIPFHTTFFFRTDSKFIFYDINNKKAEFSAIPELMLCYLTKHHFRVQMSMDKENEATNQASLKKIEELEQAIMNVKENQYTNMIEGNLHNLLPVLGFCSVIYSHPDTSSFDSKQWQQQMLDIQKENLQQKDLQGQDILWKACAYADASFVELLLQQKMLPDTHDNNGDSAMFRAALSNQLEIVELLVAAGGNINIQNKNGNTPLNGAIMSGNLEIAKWLLDKGAILNNEEHFHHACVLGKEELVEEFLLRGASVTSADMLVAAQYNHGHIIKLLAKHSYDINNCDKDGSTPLMYAVSYGNLCAIHALVELGANFNIRNHHNLKAIDFTNKPELIYLLVQLETSSLQRRLDHYIKTQLSSYENRFETARYNAAVKLSKAMNKNILPFSQREEMELKKGVLGQIYQEFISLQKYSRIANQHVYKNNYLFFNTQQVKKNTNNPVMRTHKK